MDAVQIVVLDEITIVMILVDGGLGAILGIEQTNELGSIAVFFKKVKKLLAITVTREILGTSANVSQFSGRHFKPAVASVRVKRKRVVHRENSMVEDL